MTRWINLLGFGTTKCLLILKYHIWYFIGNFRVVQVRHLCHQVDVGVQQFFQHQALFFTQIFTTMNFWGISAGGFLRRGSQEDFKPTQGAFRRDHPKPLQPPQTLNTTAEGEDLPQNKALRVYKSHIHGLCHPSPFTGLCAINSLKHGTEKWNLLGETKKSPAKGTVLLSAIYTFTVSSACPPPTSAWLPDFSPWMLGAAHSSTQFLGCRTPKRIKSKILC